MSEDSNAKIQTLAEAFSACHQQAKEMGERKRKTEEELKDLLEEFRLKTSLGDKKITLVLGDKKITFSSTVRKGAAKVSEVLELVHKVFRARLPAEADSIMETLTEEIEEGRGESTVRVLRISEN